MDRLNRNVTPGGTVTRTVYDAPGRPIGTWVGTNDTGATSSNPAGSGPPNNMVQITGLIYDNGLAGGDSNVTRKTNYVDATGLNDRVTTFLFDFRDRRTDMDGEVDFYRKVYYDNLDRLVKTDRYDTSLAGNLIGRWLTNWDDRSDATDPGDAFQKITFAVDPTTGIVGNSLVDNKWFDASRNEIKSLPAGSRAATKTAYDSLGRETVEYVGYNYSDTTYATAVSIAGDTLFEQTETAYDAASNAVQTTLRQRYHGATSVGALGSPTSAQPQARVTYNATYPDPLGRLAAHADYGTNGGASLIRSSTIPAPSDTCLINSDTFNARGESYVTTDPAGIVTYRMFDDQGRRLTLIENYIATTNSSSSSSSGAVGPQRRYQQDDKFQLFPGQPADNHHRRQRLDGEPDDDISIRQHADRVERCVEFTSAL